MIVFSTIPTQTDAGQIEAVVNDLDTHRILTDMLKELKKMEEKIEEPKKTVEAKPKSRFGKMLQE